MEMDIAEKSDEPLEATVTEYKKLITQEIDEYKAALCKAETELAEYKNRISAPVEARATKSDFLNERPDYVQYLVTLKKYHEKNMMLREQEMIEAQKLLLTGERFLRSELKKTHQ